MVNWTELKPALYPIQNYEDLSRRWKEGYAYNFVRRCFNFSLPEMIEFVNQQLGGNTHHNYDAWLVDLNRIFGELVAVEIPDIVALVGDLNTREQFEGFIARTGLDPASLISVLKYLVYWFIPAKKPMRQLYRDDPRLTAILPALRGAGIRTSLDLIEAGLTPESRRALAEGIGAPLDAVTELVHRADFSRMPWMSAATISNLVGAGYPSLAKLVSTDLDVVSANFYRYGESIGKNFKYGNDIENLYRIALILPRVIVD